MSSALTSEEFAEFIKAHDITEFYIAGADAAACVKSTCYNLTKVGYTVRVLSDCVTSYGKKKLPETMEYYAGKGCTVARLDELMQEFGADRSKFADLLPPDFIIKR